MADSMIIGICARLGSVLNCLVGLDAVINIWHHDIKDHKRRRVRHRFF